ncbi:MAG: hypothetical protein EP305_09205 [Bacteroidetes bacterium]|nr:MAG: hypothetical protein EP305_09205 [Bacteroidota bacterium]
MRFLVSNLFLMITSILFSQSDSLTWKEIRSFELGKSETWNVDILQNVYLTKKNLLKKYDSVGVMKFSQSFRSVGRISAIEPVNFMKVLVFSEEQQSVCWLDNTLTLGNDCIDLSDLGFDYAMKVAVSGQPDKIWIIDQLNLKLRLVPAHNSAQFQEIKNLNGIAGIVEAAKIMEYNNELFLLDRSTGIYRFDLYGSLIEHIKNEEVEDIGFWNGHLLLLKNDQLQTIDLSNGLTAEIGLPIKGVKEFRISDKLFYLRTEEKVINYRVSLAD